LEAAGKTGVLQDLERSVNVNTTDVGVESGGPRWTFLTNHSHVLICITEDDSVRSRDIAARVGITERAVQRIVRELCEAGYVTKVREGRRNRYTVHLDLPLRHPVEGHCAVSDLFETVRRPQVTENPAG